MAGSCMAATREQDSSIRRTRGGPNLVARQMLWILWQPAIQAAPIARVGRPCSCSSLSRSAEADIRPAWKPASNEVLVVQPPGWSED